MNQLEDLSLGHKSCKGPLVGLLCLVVVLLLVVGAVVFCPTLLRSALVFVGSTVPIVY